MHAYAHCYHAQLKMRETKNGDKGLTFVCIVWIHESVFIQRERAWPHLHTMLYTPQTHFMRYAEGVWRTYTCVYKYPCIHVYADECITSHSVKARSANRTRALVRALGPKPHSTGQKNELYMYYMYEFRGYSN